MLPEVPTCRAGPLATIRPLGIRHGHLPLRAISPVLPGLDALSGQGLYVFPSLLPFPDPDWHFGAIHDCSLKQCLSHSGLPPVPPRDRVTAEKQAPCETGL